MAFQLLQITTRLGEAQRGDDKRANAAIVCPPLARRLLVPPQPCQRPTPTSGCTPSARGSDQLSLGSSAGRGAEKNLDQHLECGPVGPAAQLQPLAHARVLLRAHEASRHREIQRRVADLSVWGNQS